MRPIPIENGRMIAEAIVRRDVISQQCLAASTRETRTAMRRRWSAPGQQRAPIVKFLQRPQGIAQHDSDLGASTAQTIVTTCIV